MGPVRIFLDANILFSAALGGRSFALLWELARAEKVTLLTSRYCRIEAERNLSRKRPASLKAFGELLEWVAELSGGRGMEQGMKGTEGDVQLPEKDRPVYEAAVAAEAEVLLTGDTAHFGHLMKRTDLPLRVRVLRDFLLEGRPEQRSKD